MRSTSLVSCLVSCLVAFAALAGCGDDGALTFDSGVSGKKPLSELTDDDAQEMCLAFADYMNSVVPETRAADVACTMAGITAEATLGGDGQCEVTRDQCLAEGSEVEPFMGDVDCTSASAADFGAGCEATVSDVERCISDMGAAMDRLLDRVSCARLAGDPEATAELEVEIQELFDGGGQPASCAELSETCPELNIFG